ncbi:MAG: energy transducer TonB [Flavobacteriaceae bacterium]
MSGINFSKKEWIDLVFENRNKSYGAYQLRAESGRTMLKALFLGVLLLMSFVSIPVIANHFSEPELMIVPEGAPDEVIRPVAYIPDLPKPEPEKPKQQATQRPAQDVIKDVAPTITQNTETNEEMLSRDEVQGLVTGDENVEGQEGGSILTVNPGNEDQPGDENGSPDGVEDGVLKPFEVDSTPEFPGGLDRFYKIVGKNFAIPQINRETTAIVYVSFVVETDGSLSDIQVLRDPGYGLGQEAIRVLKNIKTKWKPGIKNGEPVRTSYNLPIKVNIR